MTRCIALCGVLFAFAVDAQTRLSDGVPIETQLAAVGDNQVIIGEAFFIDVPAATKQVDISLTEGGSGRDLDLFVKLDTPFSNNFTSFDEFFASADFYSISVFPDESIVLQQSVIALQGRRVYVQPVAFSGALSSATLRADFSDESQPVAFEVDFANRSGDADCDTAPWNDPTTFVPLAGNNATTLGAARRNAMLEAARLLSRELFSPVPVLLQACWEAQGGEQTSAPLANAGPKTLAINTPGVAIDDTLYVPAVMTRHAGTTLSGIFGGDRSDEPEVRITYNLDVGSADVLPSLSWYYGFSRGGLPASGIDFISVTMHEIAHGLGFLSTLTESGGLQTVNGQPTTDAFLRHLVDNRGTAAATTAVDDPSLSDAERLAIVTSGTGLQWSGAEATLALENIFSLVDDSYLRMHAPEEFTVAGSASHLNASYCELMTATLTSCRGGPHRALGLARPMLHAVGWAPASDTPPYLGFMYDRRHNGHGIEFQLGGQDAQGRNLYVLTFYSYENVGAAPEWFQAVGVVENGVFSGSHNGAGYGFPRFLYQTGRTPPQQADAGTRGQVVLNFNNPDGNDACDDGVNRSTAESMAVLQWVIGNRVDSWCMEPLVTSTTRPDIDFGGLWFAGEVDTGWGFSLENSVTADGSVDLFLVLFVYAADGTPVWYFATGTAVDLSQPIDLTLFQQTGFPRSVSQGAVQAVAAGTFTLTLTTPSSDLSAGNRASVDVAYQASEGGDWIRDNVPIQRLSLPRG